MTLITRIGAISGFLLFSACTTLTTDDWLDDADASAARFQKDLETLASDAYEGREAGTPGYDKAVDYVTASFKKIGLAPAGEEGYLQQVPLRRAFAEADGASLSVASKAGESKFTLYEDYIALNGQVEEVESVTADVVYVGHGIDAPMFGEMAYRDHDVRGKIVAMVSGTPSGLPSEERAHFGSGRTKRATAAKYGAVGIINLSPTRGAGEAGKAQMSRTMGTPANLVGHEPGSQPNVDAYALLTQKGSEKFLSLAGVDQTDFFNGDVDPGPMGVEVTLSTKTRYEDYQSPNVVAVLEGDDPELKDEFVVLTAHLDHIGKLKSVEVGTDIINNGAMDNASGISTLLEEARKFTSDKDRPRRSILFVALTAEEKGLLGSEYFAQNPTVDADAMVANVNLDMPVLLHEFTDVIAFGAQHSTMKEIAERAANSMGVEIIPDPVPEMALFVRSDHYNFVKVGVPSVFLFLGFGNGGEESFRNFMSTNYHRPSDQLDLPIMYDMAAKFAELNYRIAKEIANNEERPEWHEGDFFGDVFSKNKESE